MTAKRVLVAYGSKHGATAGIADEIGRTLRAEQRTIPPVPGVARRMRGLGAREHITFGGAVTAATPGRIARSLVRHGKGGDFRDPARIQAWAHHIGDELTGTGGGSTAAGPG